MQCLKTVTDTETKSSWWATPNATEVKRDAHIALPAAGNDGAFELMPTKSAQYATNGTMPQVL